MSTRANTPNIDVICTGSTTERGHAQGEAMAATIQESADAIHELEAFRLQSPWWLPYGAFVRLADWKAERAHRSGLFAELPEAWDRLVALSKGSGVSVRRLALLNALEPVLSDLSGCVTGLEAGCSAVAVGPDRSGGHGAILAHNFDYLPLVQRFYCIRDERPEKGFRNIEQNDSPLDPATLAKQMANHGPAESPSRLTLCMHSDYWYTTACIQLLPEARRIRVSYSTACQAQYTDFVIA